MIDIISIILVTLSTITSLFFMGVLVLKFSLAMLDSLEKFESLLIDEYSKHHDGNEVK